MGNVVDPIQRRLTDYASAISFDGLSPESIHVAKVRVVDTLGALIGGFFAEPCRLTRNLAARRRSSDGATIIGTRIKVTPDLAAFVNGTTQRYIELTDSYHWPGSFGGHPSDVITPVLAVAEHLGASGREFITSVVMAYEIYLRIDDEFHNMGFDHTTFACLATAVAAGKLLGLSSTQLSHCISMALVPNNALRLSRMGHTSMWKVAATGQAGRAGVFAALLARAGMEGPDLLFSGDSGWCNHIALENFSLEKMGGHGTPFKILDPGTKLRPSCGLAIAPIFAAEKIAPVKNLNEVSRITVEVYKKAKERSGTGDHYWNPDSKETADHSIPYCVAAALMDGRVTLRSFNEAHLRNERLRALMNKIDVVENPEFTKANVSIPVQHRARVTVITQSGEKLVGETDQADDLAAARSDAQIEEKFRGLVEDHVGKGRTDFVLDRLWKLEDVKDIAEIPPAFALC